MERITRGTFARTLCGSSCEGQPDQSSYPIKHERIIECKTDDHIPLVAPRRGSSRSPDTCSGRPEAGTSYGRPCAESGNRLTRMASTTQGRNNRRIPHLSSRRESTTRSTSSSRASSSETCFEQGRRKAQFIHSFPERRGWRSVLTQESCAMQKES